MERKAITDYNRGSLFRWRGNVAVKHSQGRIRLHSIIPAIRSGKNMLGNYVYTTNLINKLLNSFGHLKRAEEDGLPKKKLL